VADERDGADGGGSGTGGDPAPGASGGDPAPGTAGTAAGARPGGARGGVQETLFDEGVPAPPEEGVGYRGPTACAVAGITYRQLDYWARTGLVTPSVRDASGSGTQRLYSFRDVLVLKLVRRLLDTGISLQNIRTAVGQLRAGGAEELAEITLLSDGTTVYECTSADEVVDLLQGGQGVFAIAVGKVVREVEGSLAELPGERAEDEAAPAEHTGDELSARRRKRGA
jgi:DNA-binding transcriptional MerR regulator